MHRHIYVYPELFGQACFIFANHRSIVVGVLFSNALLYGMLTLRNMSSPCSLECRGYTSIDCRIHRRTSRPTNSWIHALRKTRRRYLCLLLTELERFLVMELEMVCSKASNRTIEWQGCEYLMWYVFWVSGCGGRMLCLYSRKY